MANHKVLPSAVLCNRSRPLFARCLIFVFHFARVLFPRRGRPPSTPRKLCLRTAPPLPPLFVFAGHSPPPYMRECYFLPSARFTRFLPRQLGKLRICGGSLAAALAGDVTVRASVENAYGQPAWSVPVSRIVCCCLPPTPQSNVFLASRTSSRTSPTLWMCQQYRLFSFPVITRILFFLFVTFCAPPTVRSGFLRTWSFQFTELPLSGVIGGLPPHETTANKIPETNRGVRPHRNRGWAALTAIRSWTPYNFTCPHSGPPRIRKSPPRATQYHFSDGFNADYQGEVTTQCHSCKRYPPISSA